MKGMPAHSIRDMETMLQNGFLCDDNSGLAVIHGHRHNLKNRFELRRTLGEGTYGKVKLAVERSTGEQVAIKYIKKSKIRDEHDLNRIRREIKIMSTLQHPNVVNVNEVFENKDKIILVMECADGGELYDYINNNQLTERDARRIFRQIVSAIKYCHQNGIVHRDLKLENILLDRNNDAKIADFGLSNYYTDSDFLKTFCGSPLYASPEIVNGQPYYGPEVDCWSLGVVLYTLVYGTMPFDGSNFKKLRTQITTGDYYEPDKPSEAAGLIRHLLTVNPAKRANISDICSHWWVNLGHNIMPNNEPYIPPMVLQPVPSFHNQTLSSSSESDEGEPDMLCKPKIEKPLKGILKKPKMNDEPSKSRNSDSKPCNDIPMPKIDSIENENPLDIQNKGDDSVFKEPSVMSRAQTGSSCDNCSQGVVQSNVQAVDDIDEMAANLDGTSAKKVPFDSQVKPKRGILKRKGKFSAGDSGCDLNDSTRKDSVGLAVRPMDLSEVDSAIDSPDHLDNKFGAQNIVSGNAPQPGAFSFGPTESLSARNCSSMISSDVVTTVVPRRRGILKNTSRDSDKRLSACSIGSNSSADILDFSYDSSDEILTRFCRPMSQKSPVDFDVDVSDKTLQSNIQLQNDLFNYEEATDVCKKALELCKDF